MYVGLDEMQRDPKELNTHTEVTFEDVFGEPSHVHSIDCTWRYSRLLFNAALGTFYILLSTLCALPTALCCGMKFACLAFKSVWCEQPTQKAFTVWLVPIRAVYSATVRCLLDPIVEAFAACWLRAKTPADKKKREEA